MAFRYDQYFENICDHFPDAYYEDIRKKSNELFCYAVLNQETGKCKSHYHEYLEILYVVSSSLLVTVNKHEYEVKSGDMLILIPGDVHSMLPRKGCRYICLQSDTDFLFASALTNSDLHYIMPYTLANNVQARLFEADTLDSTSIPKLIYDIASEYSVRKNFYKLSIRSDLSAVALYVFRYWDSLAESEKEWRRRVCPARLEEAVKYIEVHYTEDLTANYLAEMSNMSYSYFSRFFKSSMGESFSDYLNSVRIRHAEKLLLKNELTISEVARAVGFSNTSYFITQFKRHLHITPKKYKNNFCGVIGKKER